jgi:hypothetical protein
MAVAPVGDGFELRSAASPAPTAGAGFTMHGRRAEALRRIDPLAALDHLGDDQSHDDPTIGVTG